MESIQIKYEVILLKIWTTFNVIYIYNALVVCYAYMLYFYT